MGEDLATKYLASDDIPDEMVDVPEWDGKVLVIGMDAEKRSEFIAATVDDEGEVRVDWRYYFVDIVIATACNPDTREPIFDAEKHREALVKKSGAVVDRLSSVGSRLSGLDTKAAVEKAGKGSPKTASGSTSTR